MLIDGLTLTETSTVANLALASGSTLPAEARLGELFFKTGTDSGLYTYSATGWVIAGKREQITAVLAGPITPQAGTLRWYPSQNSTITAVEIFGTAPSETLVFDILKNGSSLYASKPQLPVGETYASVAAPASPNVLETDYLTINVISGVASDICIRITF